MYEDYLKALLAPLRVYDLQPGTINGAELYALGKGFDGVSEQLDLTEREALTATAEDEGLSRREALFARRHAAFTPEERRAVFMSMQSPLARRSWTACFRRRWTRFQAWSP